jgi:hypothetical protein
MIPIRRVDPGAKLAKRLEVKTAQLQKENVDTERARNAWKNARAIRRDLLDLLEKMAPGVRRCMYCGDGEGTDIDHFKPIAKDPYVTFVWLNHLLACSYCNSNAKRNQFPCGPYGEILLINPAIDDPRDHIVLNFATGQYTAMTAKGVETIEVFGLCRPVLQTGRQVAYVRCKSMLRDWMSLKQMGEDQEASFVLGSLKMQPFADVFYSMIRRRGDVGASAVFGAEVIAALRELPLSL